MTRVVLHINTLRLQGQAGLGVAEREALVAAFVQTLQSQMQVQLALPGALGQLSTQGHRERLRLGMGPAPTPASQAAQAGPTERSAEWGERAATSLCGGLLP